MNKLIIFTAVFFTGCTSKTPVCDIAKKIAAPVSGVIAAQLECKNKAAIEADIVSLLEKKNVCDPKTAGVEDVLCPLVIDAVLGEALKQVPATWECSGGAVKDGLREALTKACADVI